MLDEARARGLADGLADADFARPLRRGEAVPIAAAGAVHDQHAAAGGRPQAAPVVVAGDARRPGPVRARLHHLHAHRQRGAVRRGAAGGASRGGQRVRRAVPVAAAQAVHVEDEERPGGPRGDPPDDAAAVAEPGRRRAQRPGAGAVPADLAAHAGVADGRRHRHDRHRAARRHRGRRHGRRVRRLGHDDHVPRLPPGVRRVPRRRATGTASARRCSRRSPSATPSPSRRSNRRATPRRRRPATPRRRSSSGSRSSASAGHRRGRRSSRPSRTAATCGRRARRWCRRGPRSPSST